MRRGALAWNAAAWVFPTLTVLLPLVSFLAISFWKVENNALVPTFTLANYAEIFNNEIYLRVLSGTGILALQVMLACLLLGYPVALFVWRRQGLVRWALLFATALPLFLGYIIKLYAIRSLLGPMGFINQALLAVGLLDRPSTALLFNQRAVLITMAMVYLPFAVLPIFLSLERVPKGLLAASADLGASEWQTFRHVVLPLSLPGTIVGGLFAVVLAMGDFVTPQMVGGTTGFTYGRAIQSQFGMAFNWPFGAALAVLLLAASLIVIGLGDWIQNRNRT
ncbi:MAG: ABC transporter permease [Geminicoccaceae bacterium]